MRGLGSQRLAVRIACTALVALILLEIAPSVVRAANALSPAAYKYYIPLILRPYPLSNGDFESGRVAWQEYSSRSYKIIVSGSDLNQLPHGGSWAAWLGGAWNETASITQSVAVLPSMHYLVYWRWILSEEATCGTDTARVLVNATIVQQGPLCILSNSGGWVRQVIDLNAYAGSTVSLQFIAYTNGSGNSSLYLDDISLQPSAASGFLPEIPLSGIAPAPALRAPVREK